MKHYAIVMLEYGRWVFTYDGRNAFICRSHEQAKDMLEFFQKEWPNEKYQIVEFDVKEPA